MSNLLSSPLFGVVISLIAFEIGCIISKKTKQAIFNPLLIGISLVILILTSAGVSLKSYNNGGQIISFFLGPATVVLAVPLYKKIKLLKAHAVPIISGITVGSCVGIAFIIVLAHLLGLNKTLNLSLVAKSVTVPIGMEVSKQLGGIPAVTVAVIIITGIIGAVFGPVICKIFRIKDEVAVGVAIGTAAHAVGTSKAIELGETQGAMSSLAIGIAGLITVIAAPIITNVLGCIIH